MHPDKNLRQHQDFNLYQPIVLHAVRLFVCLSAN